MIAATTVSGAMSGATRKGSIVGRSNMRKGMLVGAAIRPDQLRDSPELMSAFLAFANYVSPEIHLNWNFIEPNDGVNDYSAMDEVVRLAAQYDLSVHGHMLLWDQSTPEWARSAIQDPQTGWGYVRRHFANVMNRYRSRIRHWDVVNEPIDTEETGTLRANCFYRAFGPTYVERALESAAEIDPQAKLLINEYSLEYENETDRARRLAVLRLVERLLSSGTPLHAFGLQAHLDLAKGGLKSSTTRTFLAELAAFGLELFITELDVKESEFGHPLKQRDIAVADEVRRYLEVALDQPAVKGVTTWGVSDAFSWLQDQSQQHDVSLVNRGLPYDTNMQPKPMHSAIVELTRLRDES